MLRKSPFALLVPVLATSCFISPPTPAPLPTIPDPMYRNIGVIELSKDRSGNGFGMAFFRRLATPGTKDKLNLINIDTCKVFLPQLDDPAFEGTNLNVGDEIRIDSVGASGSLQKLVSLKVGPLADFQYFNDAPFSLPPGGFTASIQGNDVIDAYQNLPFPVTPRSIDGFSPPYVQIMTEDYKPIAEIEAFRWAPTNPGDLVSISGRTSVQDPGRPSINFECQARDDGNFVIPRATADLLIRLGYFDVEITDVARKNLMYASAKDTLIYTITSSH